MPRAKDFRRIALGMEGAIESAHMGHPDFRVQNRIFATLHHDDAFGMVKLTPDEQRTFMEDHPMAFQPESGAWGRAGCTRVRLDAVDEDVLGQALTLGWRSAATQPAPRPRARAATSARAARRR